MKWTAKTVMPLIFMGLVGCGINETSMKVKPDLALTAIQAIGSHNSYKEPIQPALLTLMQTRDNHHYRELQYSHPNLRNQLSEYGLRNLELDVLHDPDGGLYAAPLGNQWLKSLKKSPQVIDKLQLNQPGFKVLHQPDVDFRSNCLTLAACLSEIKEWSNENPRHVPIAITFNAKSDTRKVSGFVIPRRFTSAVYDELDRALVAGLGQDKIITPDEVRGRYSTLKSAVLDRGWPALNKLRGRFILVLDEGEDKRAHYLRGHPSLRGRVMFTQSTINDDYAAFMIINNPIEAFERIQKRVLQGFIIRTRADSATKEGHDNDLARFNHAIQSGAHYITTDFYGQPSVLNNDYKVRFSNNMALQCNPLTTKPADCNVPLEQ